MGSPALNARVAMANIKPEYAKANKHILVTVPYSLPTHKMRKRAVRTWVRGGALRSAYRRLVGACVVPLPIVRHRYPEPERQMMRAQVARRGSFRPPDVRAREKVEEAGLLGSSERP